MTTTPLSRAALLGPGSFRPSKLVEAAGVTFRIVGLSSGELRRGEELAGEASDVSAASWRRTLTALRYGVVDEDLRPIFESAEEVEAFENKLPQGALLALAGAIFDMTIERTDVGKVGPPSSPSPASSPPTTSPSSSDASPASSTTSPPASSA